MIVLFTSLELFSFHFRKLYEEKKKDDTFISTNVKFVGPSGCFFLKSVAQSKQNINCTKGFLTYDWIFVVSSFSIVQ